MRGWRLTAVTLTLTALVALAIVRFGVSRASVSEAPIRVEGQRLVVENQTPQAWSNVIVTINAYYGASAQSLNAGARLEAPLANLQTGLGQRFNVMRERVTRVEVRATDASGRPVSLDWDEKTAKPLAEQLQGR
jgi:hypothetical protein